MSEERIEVDAIGEMTLPGEAYYGGQPRRAMENFAVSGRVMNGGGGDDE